MGWIIIQGAMKALRSAHQVGKDLLRAGLHRVLLGLPRGHVPVAQRL